MSYDFLRSKVRQTASRAHPGNRVWAEGGVEQYLMSYVRVVRYELNWMRSPDFAKAFGEPDA